MPTIHQHEGRASGNIQEAMAQHLSSWNGLSTTWTVMQAINNDCFVQFLH